MAAAAASAAALATSRARPRLVALACGLLGTRTVLARLAPALL